MIEVRIPKEIKEYKEKVLVGFTLREAISLGLSVAIGFLTYKYGQDFFGSDNITTTIVMIDAPILLFGFIKIKDMNFEQFLLNYLKMSILPQKRYYAESDIMTSILLETLDYEEQERLRQSKKKSIFQTIIKKKDKGEKEEKIKAIKKKDKGEKKEKTKVNKKNKKGEKEEPIKFNKGEENV